jgi:hypothetical protein
LPTAENPEQALNPDSSDYLKPPEATIYRRLCKKPSGIARKVPGASTNTPVHLQHI